MHVYFGQRTPPSQWLSDAKPGTKSSIQRCEENSFTSKELNINQISLGFYSPLKS